MADYTGGILQ